MSTGPCRAQVERERTYKYVHLGRHIDGLNEFMGNTHALWLHGMMNAVGVGANVGWEKDWAEESIV